MAPDSCSRHIQLEAVFNFRDLGGYPTTGGRRLAWRRLFRSGELRHMTPNDLRQLHDGLRLKSVLDLRNTTELEKQGIGALDGAGFRYHNVPLSTDSSGSSYGLERLHELKNTGEVYSLSMRDREYGRRLVECLNVIAESDNHPVVFHCSAGKDRTGVLAAVILSIMGVGDRDVMEDYSLTTHSMPAHLARSRQDPENARFLDGLPAWMHESSGESMKLFLSTIRQEYGSTRDYLTSRGADSVLFERLEEALLV